MGHQLKVADNQQADLEREVARITEMLEIKEEEVEQLKK
jgi:hypothetical protein